MTYEDIWQKIKKMSQRDRKMLAYEMTLKDFNVGYIHPHYYFDAKAVHDILFYAPHSPHEIEDKDNQYYQALKSIIEDDNEIHICIKLYPWLPRFINNMSESKIVRNYVCSRINEDITAAKYNISPSKDITGECPRSLFLTLKDGEEVVYNMTECRNEGNSEYLTFGRYE